MSSSTTSPEPTPTAVSPADLVAAQLRAEVVAKVILGGGLRNEVDDVVQEALVELLRHIKAGRPVHDLVALLVTITRRRAIDAYRKAAARRTVPFDDDFLLEVVASAEQYVAMREELVEAGRLLVEIMTPAERRVFLLCQCMELSYRETAERLGVSEGTVSTLLKRARVKLALWRERHGI